jgi:putative transposase
MRKIEFINDHYYHIFNRGVDKRAIFSSERDFSRFYESLYLFNDANYKHRDGHLFTRLGDLSCHEINEEDRSPLVSIVSFCLMKNHFHLLLRQKVEGGISLFMKKITQGYSRYFNEVNERSGTLFEGRYKAVEVKADNHFLHMPRYIHLNALDGINGEWRKGSVEDWQRAKRKLDEFEWSSHHVYKGKDQILPVVDLLEVRDLFVESCQYEAYLKEWASGVLNIDYPHLYSEEFIT